MIEDEIKRYFEKEVKPQLDKLAEEYFSKKVPEIVNWILDSMDFHYHGYTEPICARKCTSLERLSCKRQIRKEVIIDLHREGYINDRKMFGWDFWNGK